MGSKSQEKTKAKRAVPAKQPSSLPAPQLSDEQIRDIVLRGMVLSDDPKQLFPLVYEQAIKDGKKGTVKGEHSELAEKAVFALGFENDYTLTETIDEKYRPMAIELRRQLIRDFNCRTYAEKVLVDSIVGGYMRTLRCARVFNNCTHREFLSEVNNAYMANASKEMDRAQRQLTTAYQLLVQLKRPPLKVQVKAKTAFVAQNQQLNVAQAQAENKRETVNEPV